MKNIALLDTETTGVDESATCIEVALAIFHVPSASVTLSYSSLLRAGDNPAEKVNRISPIALADAPLPTSVWRRVRMLLSEAGAGAIVAHGADFDRRFVPAEVAGDHAWICSMDDLAWPCADRPRQSLVSLALAHDLGVSHAHRAATDVDLLARLLARVAATGHDLPAFLARGLRPKSLFVVADRSFSEERNRQAKAAGFEWDKPRAPRQWSRWMPSEDTTALPFGVLESAERAA